MAHMVVFAGEYDLASKTELRKEFHRLKSVEQVVLDMSEVTYLDSSFLSELLSLQKTRREKRLQSVTVIAPSKCLVRKLFKVTGMLALLDVVESYSDDSLDFVVEYFRVAQVSPAPALCD